MTPSRRAAALRGSSDHAPGRVRRFDTRFLAAFRKDVAVELPSGGPSGELEELVWLPIDDAKRADVPAITLTMLEELQRRLADDPELAPGTRRPSTACAATASYAIWSKRHEKFAPDSARNEILACQTPTAMLPFLPSHTISDARPRGFDALRFGLVGIDTGLIATELAPSEGVR